MKIDKVGNRGIVFTFDDLSTPDYDCPTNVYAIVGDKNFYICDTFTGPGYMKDVKKHLIDNYGEKSFIVFNSHYHWDHHWGNCAFLNSKIIAHELCLQKIQETGEEDLEKNKKYMKGKVVITPPNLLFKNNLNFEEDRIKLFHSPGHTEDSSSCFDGQDKILFAADNIEEPIPYLNSTIEGLKIYIDTLKKYLELNASIVIPGHGRISTNQLIKDNLEYIENFPELLKSVTIEKQGLAYFKVHFSNLNIVGNKEAEVNNKELARKLYTKMLDFVQYVSEGNEELIKQIHDKINNLEK